MIFNSSILTVSGTQFIIPYPVRALFPYHDTKAQTLWQQWYEAENYDEDDSG